MKRNTLIHREKQPAIHIIMDDFLPHFGVIPSPKTPPVDPMTNDSASAKIGDTIHLTPTTVGDTWTYVEWTSPAPAGAVGHYYSLEGLFSNGGVNAGGTVNADGGIFYDDAGMTPEPVTLSLLGLGGLALLRRRKA